VSAVARQIEIVDLQEDEDEEELADDEIENVTPSAVPSDPSNALVGAAGGSSAVTPAHPVVLPHHSPPNAAAVPPPTPNSTPLSSAAAPVVAPTHSVPLPAGRSQRPPPPPASPARARETAAGVSPVASIIVDEAIDQANPVDISSLLPLSYPAVSAQYSEPLLPDEPAPVIYPAKLQREVLSVEKHKPANAAILLCAWALELLSSPQPAAAKSAVAHAKKLAPDLRVVAWTQRMVADYFADTKESLQLLRTEVALIRDSAERAAMLRYLAQLEPTAEAHEKALREAVALEPSDCAGWDLLAAHYLRKRSYKDATAALESLAANVGDSAARSVILAASASIRESALDDASGAIVTAKRALEAHPGHIAAWCIVEQLYLRGGAWADYGRSLIAQGAQIDDAETARELFDRAGDVFWLCARDNNSTARCYEHAFALAPSERVSLEKLRSLTEFTGRYDSLPRTFERLLRLVSDPRERAALFLSLGALLDARLQRTDEAILAYQSALETLPTLTPAADALAALYLRTNRWDSWCTLARTEAERVESATARAARYVSIGLVYESKLSQVEEAVALYERALSLDPCNPAAFDSLERIYRSRGDFQGLLSVLERASEATKDPARKWVLRQQMAQLLLDHAGDTQRALALFTQLATEPPHPGLTIASLARVQALAGDWPGYVETLEKLVATTTDRDEQLRALERVAAMTDSCLNDPARSLHAWNNVLQKSPQHEQALHAIAQLHEQAGRWDELLNAERKLLALARDPVEAALRWHRIGRINEDRLGRPEKAVEAYEQALLKAPMLDTARAELERVLRQLNRFARLAELCEQQATQKKIAAEKAELLVRSARIVELGLKDVTRATALYEQALAAEPTSLAALWGLVRLHEMAKRWPQVESLLKRLLSLPQSNVARMRISARLARLYESVLQSPIKAAACYEDALGAHAAGSVHVLDRLRTARVEYSSDVMIHWLARGAQVLTDSRYCRALLSLRANLVAVDAADPAPIIEAQQSVLALDERDRGALEGFLRALAGKSSDPRWPNVLRARALATESNELRWVGCYGAARSLETLHQADKSQAILMQLVNDEGVAWCVLETARTLATANHQYGDAVLLALRAAESAMDPDNRADSLLDAAMLQATELGAMTEALAQVRLVLERSPHNARALRLAVTLMEGMSDWQGIHWALGLHCGAVSDAETKVRMLIRRADIASEFLQDFAGALLDLQKARALQPARTELIERLALLQMRAQHWSDAAQSWQHIAQQSEDPALRAQALLTEARVWSDHVRDDAKAFALLDRLHRDRPDDRTIAMALARVCARKGDIRRAIELLAGLTQSGDWTERVKLALAVATLEREGLGNEAQAHVHQRAVFDVAVMQHEVHPAITEYFTRTDRWTQFCNLAEDALKRAPTNAPAALALHLMLAQVLRDKLQNPSASDQHLRATVELFPRATEPRLTLAVHKIATDELGALHALREIIELDPSCGPAFRAMVIAHQRTGSTLTAGVAASAAALLGVTEAPVDTALSLAVSPPPKESVLAADEALELLVGRTQAWHVRRLMAQLDPHLYEIFPSGIESLRTYTRVAETTAHAQMLRAITACYGLGAIPMYLGRGREASVVLAAPHAIVVGSEYFAEGATGHFIFQVASLVARISGQSAMVLSSASEQALALLEVLTDNVADAPGYKELRKRAQSILPRRVRKDIETIGDESAGNLRTEFARWQDEELRRALRSATLLARDVRIVAQFVAPAAVALPTIEQRRVALAQNPLMVEALRFVASVAAHRGVERVFGHS
jgi:tetratricopeptide (TPR) repeat protein